VERRGEQKQQTEQQTKNNKHQKNEPFTRTDEFSAACTIAHVYGILFLSDRLFYYRT